MPDIVGEVFRAALLRAGLTQTALAARLGLKPANVAIWIGNGWVPNVHQGGIDKILKGADWRTSEEEAVEADVSPFGRWLQEAREAQGLTVTALADRAGVTPATINNLESGRSRNPQNYTRQSLTDALDRTPNPEVIQETENEEAVEGLGTLVDFEPFDAQGRPAVSGVYILYDELRRASYVGIARNIAARFTTHDENTWWFRSPCVEVARYIPVQELVRRRQLEGLLIKVFRPLFNRQGRERYNSQDED